MTRGAFTLDTVRRLAGIQLHPFWFDPPDSGDAKEFAIVPFTDDGNWTFFSIDHTFGTDATHGATLELTATAATVTAGVGRAVYTLPSGTSGGRPFSDFREKLIAVDYLSDGTTPASDDEHTIRLGTNLFAWGEFSLSNKILADSGLHQQFDRVYADPFRDPTVAVTVQPAVVDEIATVEFVMRPQNSGDEMHLAKFHTVDLFKRPAFVELLSYQKRQSSSNPKGNLGPLFDIDLVVREVLS